MIALGLVAAAIADGRSREPEELLADGLELEGHGDNLAAALAGGVCLTWDAKIARVADRAPAVPIALVPERRWRLPPPGTRCRTRYAHARRRVHDRPGRPARGRASPRDPPTSSPRRSTTGCTSPTARATPRCSRRCVRAFPRVPLGATLSGSGPTVIVWARDDDAVSCAAELASSYPSVRVLTLAVSAKGAHES